MQPLKLKYEKEFQHFGSCDASGVAFLEETNSFVLADDEDNILRIYQAQTSGKPIQCIEIGNYFTNNPNNREVDIEDAAILDGSIYWITSHGTNKNAKQRPERRNFFANQLTVKGNNFTVQQVGHSYSNLLDDMSREEKFKNYKLDKAATIAPKEEGGLNIEGLCATPDKHLLIGFRNPIPKGKTLLIPLKNPTELIQEEKTSAIFGDPIELDLGGLGIRSMVYWEQREIYVIAAGAYQTSNEFRFYQWSGKVDEKPEVIEIIDLPQTFNPEAIMIYPNLDNGFQIFSDDGSVKRDNKTKCKDLPPDSDQKFFRSAWVSVQSA